MARRLRRFALLATVLAATAYVAAPALSSQPYMPAAVDFEQDLPTLARIASPYARASDGHPGEGTVSHRSGVISAPERFDLVGLARELRPLELRARDEGGAWSDWIETANGDPVYFGGADELQMRTRGWRPEGTLHYVNVSGTTSTVSSLLTAARQSINGAFVSVGGLLGAEAVAAANKPDVIRRSEWGATAKEGGCKPRANPEYGKVKSAAVHHTVSATRYSEAEAPGIVLAICRFHRNGNGWNDVGYNALVDRFGNIYEGRAGGLGKPVVGAHAQGFNAQTSGVASISDHSKVEISRPSLNGIADFVAWKLAKHNVPARGKATLISAGGDASRYPKGRRVRVPRIIGHRAVGLTSCPGDLLDAKLPKLRRKVKKLMDSGEPVDPPEEEPPDGGVAPK
jgi:hypothetical protein